MLKMRKRETASILLVCWLREEKNNLYRMLQNYARAKTVGKKATCAEQKER